MARAKFKLRSAGVKAILNGNEARRACRPAAEAALARAQASAPVVSGTYRDSLHIVEEKTDRLVQRVVSDVPYAMVVEADTGNLARSL